MKRCSPVLMRQSRRVASPTSGSSTAPASSGPPLPPCGGSPCRCSNSTFPGTACRRGALLAAFDEQARPEPAQPPSSVSYEPDGPLLRVVGLHRGFVSAPRDVGVRGPELDRLIARQRDYFAARNEAVEWKTYGYDETPGLADSLRAAGFAPEDEETVMIGLAAEMAAEPVLPKGVTLREVSAAADMRAIADLHAAVWNEDAGWLAGELMRQVSESADEIAIFVAEAAGTVISSARVEFRQGTDFAGLWGGSTRIEWRGRESTVPSWPAALSWLSRAESATCRWTPPRTAPRSCAASDSRLLRRPPRTSGPHRDNWPSGCAAPRNKP